MKRAIEEGPAVDWWPCRHRMVYTNWNQFSCKYQKSNSMWKRIYSITYEKSGVGLTIGTSESRRPNEIIRAGLPLVLSQHCCLLSCLHSLAGSLSMYVQGDPLQTQGTHSVLSESQEGAAGEKDFMLHILSLIGLCHVMSSPLCSDWPDLTSCSPLEADTSPLDPIPWIEDAGYIDKNKYLFFAPGSWNIAPKTLASVE